MIMKMESVQIGTQQLIFVTKFGRCRKLAHFGEPLTGNHELAPTSVESALSRRSSVG